MGHDRVGPKGNSWSVFLNAPCHKKHDYKCLMDEIGMVSEILIILLSKRNGDFMVSFLNASYHKKHECIWLRRGDLNGF